MTVYSKWKTRNKKISYCLVALNGGYAEHKLKRKSKIPEMKYERKLVYKICKDIVLIIDEQLNVNHAEMLKMLILDSY